jgi:hypothetical protein
MRMIPRNQRGTTVIEFAIILPLLLLVVFGIIEFGLLLFNKQIITNASREGARAGIVNRDPMFRFQTGDPVDVSNVVSNWLGDHLVTFGDTDEAEIVVEIWDNAAGDFDEVNDIDPDDRCKIFGCPLRVRVTYDYEFLVLSMFGFGPITLDATSRMRME